MQCRNSMKARSPSFTSYRGSNPAKVCRKRGIYWGRSLMAVAMSRLSAPSARLMARYQCAVARRAHGLGERRAPQVQLPSCRHPGCASAPSSVTSAPAAPSKRAPPRKPGTAPVGPPPREKGDAIRSQQDGQSSPRTRSRRLQLLRPEIELGELDLVASAAGHDLAAIEVARQRHRPHADGGPRSGGDRVRLGRRYSHGNQRVEPGRVTGAAQAAAPPDQMAANSRARRSQVLGAHQFPSGRLLPWSRASGCRPR